MKIHIDLPSPNKDFFLIYMEHVLHIKPSLSTLFEHHDSLWHLDLKENLSITP